MAASDRLTGKNLKVLWYDAGGTVVYDIGGDFRTLDVSNSYETVDVTAGADTARYMKGTVRVLGASLSALQVAGTASGGTATYARIRPGLEGTLLWGAEGTASGKPKAGFRAIVKSFDISYPHEGEVAYDVVFEPQGDWAFDPVTATW